ncbi:MAG: selenocysteine-specific translation elongation factor [Kiritimatiellae bacterium]|nr:selenocysteine-specific translation elongation factor [Kiritimatiellia bacterium]
MKHLILGTAGHVDHGKTALIKALTGIDCDTHKEEKRRGITINLGFAHLDLSAGLSVGIVDVPGHKDFVHTMVGGASGIDMALLVVAADSGVMPQTREHLQIMDILGIRTGLIALSKIDLADEDIAFMAEEELQNLTRGSFLAEAPITRVSSVTGEGLATLKQRIEETAERAAPRPRGEVFRMFVDRIFSVSGFGTVVTGSVISGKLRVGDDARLLPGPEKELRVRRLERHGKEVEEVGGGDRASINLVGLNREDFRRGMIVADRMLRSTTRLDAKLRLFQHAQRFRLWSQVVFHLGTFEAAARVHLIDRDQLGGGETALVQVHLDRPCVVQHGDRFVVRNSASDTTLGGGEIIDAAPLHHRRRPGRLLADLAKIAAGNLPELVAAEVSKRSRAVSYREIADALNVAHEEVRRVVQDGLPDDVVVYSDAGALYLIVRREHEALRDQVLKSLAAHHRRNPLDERGRTTEELLGVLGIARDSAGEMVLRLMLEKLQGEQAVKSVAHTWTLNDHDVVIGPETKADIEFVEGLIDIPGMKTPLLSDLKRAAKNRRMDERQLMHVLRYLVAQGKAYFVDGHYLHASIVDECRDRLLRALAKRTEGMTVADFRDLVRGNRKICLLLLAIYDAEGITERDGDLRTLTNKGRARLA